jgi:hypothetical protein
MKSFQEAIMHLTGSRNQCPSCNQYFNSNTAFDKHRTGKHGVNRRCRTTEEMTALGMLVNHAGFWITEKRNDYMDTGSSEQPDANES